MPNLVSLFTDIAQNPEKAIFNFQISNQFFIKKNYQQSRTSIEMKLVPVTIDDAILTNSEVIVIFPIYGQFGAIPRRDC